MTKKKTREALDLLQLLLDREEPTTPSDVGLTSEQVETMCSEGLVDIGCDAHGNVVAITGITARGVLVLAETDSHLDQIVVKTPHVSASGKIASALVNRLWDLVKVAFGVGLGYWLKSKFG